MTGINRPWLVALYVYSTLSSSQRANSEHSPLVLAMAFDTFIMVTCLWGLWRSKPRTGRAQGLYKLLWADGLMYFICASVANAFPGEPGLEYSSICSLVGCSRFYGSGFEPYVHDTSTIYISDPLPFSAAMDVVSTMASACVTTIVSCRAVQRLSAWGTSNLA